jgi:phosphoribosylamine--glycine ligase
VLGVTGVAETLADARDRAYDAARLIRLDDAQYRTDIAEAAIHATR